MKYRFLLIGLLFLPTVFYGMESDLEAAQNKEDTFQKLIAHIEPIINDQEITQYMPRHLTLLKTEEMSELQDRLDQSEYDADKKAIYLLVLLHQDLTQRLIKSLGNQQSLLKKLLRHRVLTVVRGLCLSTSITYLTVTLVLALMGCWPAN